DGLLARTLNQRSSLGAYLDPIADKLLLSSSFIILSMAKKIAWWLTIIVLSRDVLILIVAAVILLVSGYGSFPATLLGKFTPFFQTLVVFVVVLGEAYPHPHFATLSRVLTYVVAVTTVTSGFHYSVTIASRLHSP